MPKQILYHGLFNFIDENGEGEISNGALQTDMCSAKPRVRAQQGGLETQNGDTCLKFCISSYLSFAFPYTKSRYNQGI